MTEIQETAQYTDADYLRDAAGFLHTLSSIYFLELTQEQIDALKQIDFAAMVEGEENPLLVEGYRGMGRYLSRASLNVRQDLAVEYARIFLGAGIADGQLACPFESVFTSPEGIMMQDSRDDVVRIFRENCMKVDADLNTPEDHLSFELDFVAYKAERVADAMDEGADVKADLTVLTDFCDQHLLNWLPQLAGRVDEYADSVFYPSVMKVTIGTIQEFRAAVASM